MSYQIPKSVKVIAIKENQKLGLYYIKPSEYVRLRYAIPTIFFNGLVGADFSLKINLYSDRKGKKLLMSSNTVINSQIQRSSRYYGEIRFDFPFNSNLLGINNEHLIEIEILGSASFDDDNYIGLVLDYDNTLGNVDGSYVFYDTENLGVRCSLFFDKA